MRKIIIVSLLLIVSAAYAMAQERTANVELAYGAALTSAGLISDQHYGYYGGGFNVTKYVQDTGFGPFGDFSIHFHNDSNLMYFLGGGRYKFKGQRIVPFVEGMAGMSRLDPKVGDTQTAFVYGGGGGLDWKAWHAVSIRLPQVDFLFGRHDGEGFYDVRVLLGFTWHFF